MAKIKDKMSPAYFRLMVCKNVWSSGYFFKCMILKQYSCNLRVCFKVRAKYAVPNWEWNLAIIGSKFQMLWSQKTEMNHSNLEIDWCKASMLETTQNCQRNVHFDLTFMKHIGLNSLFLFLCLAQFHGYLYWQVARLLFFLKSWI